MPYLDFLMASLEEMGVKSPHGLKKMYFKAITNAHPIPNQAPGLDSSLASWGTLGKHLSGEGRKACVLTPSPALPHQPHSGLEGSRPSEQCPSLI